MLKLATLPRSRRERDWWRATPGRSGNAPRCHYPQKAPPSAPRYACRDVFRMQRFWNAAFQMPRVWNAAASLGSVTRDDLSVHARRPKPLAQDDPSRSSTTALGAAAARNAPRARTQLAEAAGVSTARTAGAAIQSAPGPAARAHRMRDGSVPMSINGRTEARGRAEVGAGTGDSRPRMQSAATVCAPMDKMPHHRRVYARDARRRRSGWIEATLVRTRLRRSRCWSGPHRPPSSHARTFPFFPPPLI